MFLNHWGHELGCDERVGRGQRHARRGQTSGQLRGASAWASCMWEQWEPGLPEPQGDAPGRSIRTCAVRPKGTWHLKICLPQCFRAPKDRITVRKEVGIALDLEWGGGESGPGAMGNPGIWGQRPPQGAVLLFFIWEVLTWRGYLPKANGHSGAQLECETRASVSFSIPSVCQRMVRTFSWGPQGRAEEGLDPSSKTCYSFPESRGYSLSQNPSATHHLHPQLSNL